MKRMAKFVMIIAASYGIIYMLLYVLRMWWMGYEYEVIDRAMREDPYMHINDVCRTNETMADPTNLFYDMLDDTIKEMGNEQT